MEDKLSNWRFWRTKYQKTKFCFWRTKWKIGGFGVQNSKLEDILRIGGHLCPMFETRFVSTTEDVLEDVSEDVLEGVMGEKPLVNFFLIEM